MLVKNSSIYLIAKLIPGLSGFIALSVFSHLLSAEAYGQYNLIFMIASAVHLIGFSWLVAGAYRFWHNDAYSAEQTFTTLAYGYMLIATALVLVLIATFMLVADAWKPWVLGLLVLTLTMSLFNSSLDLQTIQLKSSRYAAMNISRAVLGLVLGWLIVSYTQLEGFGVILGFTFSFLLITLTFSSSTTQHFKKGKYSPDLMRKFLIYGMPIALAHVVDIIISTSDRLLIAKFLDVSHAGMYAVGYDLPGNSINMLMSAVNLAAYPIALKLLESEGEKPAKLFMRRYIIMLFGIGLPAVSGLIMAAPTLIPLIIGETFHNSALQLLPIISISLLLMGLQIFLFDVCFQMANKPGYIIKATSAVAVLNILLNLLFIPKWGLMGAAFATVLSYATINIVNYWLMQKVFTLDIPWQDLFKVIAACVVMVLMLSFTYNKQGIAWLLLQITLGIGSYFSITYLLNVSNLRDSISISRVNHFRS